MKVLVLTLCALLAACGGGSDGSSAAPEAAPVACMPRIVTVALLGDSTQYGIDGTTTRPGYFGSQAVHNPGAVLQTVMNAQFGPGAVIVTNYGVPGSSSIDAPKVTADVIVANYGVNDMNGQVPLTQFLDRMKATGATIAETQIPTPYGDAREAGYVATTRSMGLPVADVYSYIMSLPNWQQYFPNPESVHVTDDMYKLIADNVLAPAVAKQVAPLRCSK